MSDDLKKRLLSHVRKTANGCWECNLAKVGIGYAKMTISGKSFRAHRVAYELFKGEIPEGMFILHDCDNPSCVNPEHLHLGTQTENMRERSQRGRAPTAEKNHNTKLTEEKAARIKNSLRSGVGIRKLSREYGVARNAISNIRDGRAWAYVD